MNEFKEAIRLAVEIFKKILTYLPELIRTVVNKISEKLHFSITFKTTAIYTLIISTIYLIFSLIIISAFSCYLYLQRQASLNNSSKMISSLLEYDSSQNKDQIKKYSEIEDLSASIFNEDKSLYFTTEKEKSNVAFNEASDKESNRSVIIPSDNTLYMICSTKIIKGNTFYYLQLKKSLLNDEKYIIILVFIIFFSYLLSLIFVIRKGSKTSKKMLKPIYDMTKTAQSISAHALSTRLDVIDSHDELKELAETINKMLDRIENSYELQNQFVSDASHELRTPIAVIQGYVNMLCRWGKSDAAILDESINAIKSEAENMKELVEKLLFLARADKHTQKFEIQAFELNDLISEILKETQLIDDKHTISNDYNEQAIMNGDRNLLKQAIRIFMDNAIKYTPEGGTIKLNSCIKDNRIIITIEDTGIGISENDLPRIFDRFYRCDESRTKETGGTGLGLSIAKWIIGRHHGSIEVESKLNVGTKITLRCQSPEKGEF